MLTRVRGEDGRSHEFHSALLPRYKRLRGSASALIAGAYLAGVNTRRVRLAFSKRFGGAASKDSVSRAWRRVQGTARAGIAVALRASRSCG